jgi:hypothetical protein
VQPDKQLEWERRAGPPAGIAMLIAGTLILLSLILGGRAAGKDLFDTYLKIDEDPSLILVPNIVQAIGFLLAAYGLSYLVRVTRPRRAELARPSRILTIVGPVATAIAVVVTAFAIIKVAEHVAEIAHPPRGEDARDNVIEDLQQDSSGIVAATVASYAARLALGFGLLLASLNAMRAGLLSRFSGILGIAAAVLGTLLGGLGLFVLAFWLAVVGVIFLDRWPNGRGPAWDEVEAIPWPSAMDQAAVVEDEPAEDEEDEPEAEEPQLVNDDDEAEPAATPHPVSKKRKKKKRR